MRRVTWLAAVLFVVTGPLATLAQPSVVEAAERWKVDAARLQSADRLIEQAIARNEIPGAVLLVGRGGEIVHHKAFGRRAVAPSSEPMTLDTIFDLASLTKPVACATSTMLLVDRGKLSLSDEVARYLPSFAQNGKRSITIEQLMLHNSGLIPDNPLADFADGRDAAMRRIMALTPEQAPGEKFAYSDVGYMVLGEVVRVVSGKPLDAFARDEIFNPLGMVDTGYLPDSRRRDRIAPTERRDHHWMRGEVHDPRAFALGGVAGHAGLFGTASDLSRFCQMVLNGGTLGGKRLLSSAAMEQATRPRHIGTGNSSRSLLFDVDTAYSSCRGDRFTRGLTFGHTGFTGTMFWLDPEHGCYFVLLTNAVHPDGKGKVRDLRHDVATAVGEALLGPAEGEGAPVQFGIDVLQAERFESLRGKRVAVVANQTSTNAQGKHLVELLHAAPGVRLTKIFSPEHGLFGVKDERVADDVDPKTGLKVYSLYGDVRKPTDKMLADIDVLVFDVQDVGARYYTYASTLGLCMEAAAASKVRVMVLDRPNPNTGLIVDGPLADSDKLDFVGYAPIPVSHGLTLGELARYYNAERGIGCDLTVVPMKHWRRDMRWDQCGREWVKPSPNLRSPTEALLYLGIGLLETSNLSVGRGTTTPFEVVGAPWIDADRLAAALAGEDLPGIRFEPAQFTPDASKFAGQKCAGVRLIVTSPSRLQPVRLGLTIGWHLNQLYGERFDLAAMNKLLKNDATLSRLSTARRASDIFVDWQKPLEQFGVTCQKYLLYPPPTLP